MRNFLLIYHKEDNDGVVSAALLYDWILNKLNTSKENINLLPADYNILSKFAEAYSREEQLKELHEEYDTIVMTDISFNNIKFMQKLYDEFNNDFIWFDHHAPIINTSYKYKFGDCPGIRNTNKSAILCVYEYLYDTFNLDYNDKKIPELLRILSAWDSWTYEREGYDFDYVKNINKGVTDKYGLDIYKILNDIDKFKSLDQIELINGLNKHGKLLNEYEDRKMENIIKNSGDCSWQIWDFDKENSAHPIIHKACAIFHQGATNSTMFKCLRKKGIRHGLVFKHQPDGNWVLSMYNIDDNDNFHCGDFLRAKYNGGGHKGAAGCTLDEKTFIKILKNKRI